MISNDIFPLKPSVQVGACRKYDCACYALFTQGHSYVLCRQMKKRQIPALRGLHEEHVPTLFLIPHLTHVSSPSSAARLTSLLP